MKHPILKQSHNKPKVQTDVTTLKITKRKQTHAKLVKRLSVRKPLDVEAIITNSNSDIKLNSVTRSTRNKLLSGVVDTLINKADDHWKDICDIIYKTGKHKMFIEANRNLFLKLVSNNLTPAMIETLVPTVYKTVLSELQQKENIKADSYCYARIRACAYKDNHIVVPIYRIYLGRFHWNGIVPSIEYFATISSVRDGNITVTNIQSNNDTTPLLMNFRKENKRFKLDGLHLEVWTPAKANAGFVFATCISQHNLDVNQLLMSYGLPSNIVSIISQYAIHVPKMFTT